MLVFGKFYVRTKSMISYKKLFTSLNNQEFFQHNQTKYIQIVKTKTKKKAVILKELML